MIDEHPIFRRGLVGAINEAPGFIVCGEAGTAGDALAQVAALRPDVAVVDLALGHDSGLGLIDALAASPTPVRILVVSEHDERLYAERALRAGALGYITKDRAASELILAVRRVAEGRAYLSSEAAERILMTFGRAPRSAANRSPIERLSDRERHVLMLVGRGFSTREIAGQLHISVKTVETHCAHVKQKLGLKNARELTRMALSLAERRLAG